MERIECCGNCAHYDACNNIMKRYTDFGELNKDGAACGYYAVRLDEILGGDYNLDRLRELVEADRYGFVHIMKFPVNSLVFRAFISPGGSKRIVECIHIDTLSEAFKAEEWDNAFSTSDEAWEYLKNFRRKVQDDEQQ